MKNKRILKNGFWLMIFQISKIIFPFLTLPYLTRVFTTDTYGVVTYTKTIMTYMQVLIDFGFLLSATKDIINCKSDKEKMSYIIGDTLIARIILGIIGFIIMWILCLALPILREYKLYAMLSYIVVFESIFLFDFVFRGLEEMQLIAIRFILMKVISLIFTFIFIKNDSDILLIPILDILSSFIAIIMVIFEMRKRKIKMKFTKIATAFNMIKESFVYFISNVATTSFNALSTIVIGICLSKTEVAFWGVSMQIIGTITACYTPITDSIYPEMIRSKNINYIKKTLKVFTPIILIGCILAYIIAPLGMNILGGKAYEQASNIFRMLIPVLLLGFFSVMLGWPTLGAIEKQKEVTFSTIVSIVFNIIATILFIILKNYTVIVAALIRNLTELVLSGTRLAFVIKYKDKFNEGEI